MTARPAGHDRRSAAGRLAGVDAARGVALIGMIVVNVGPMIAGSWLQRLHALPYGRASILFVLLAGIGMGFFLRGRQGRDRWPSLLWRAVLLFVVGAALQESTENLNVILTMYAALFLLAPLLWRLRTRTLAVVTALLWLVGPGVIVAGGPRTGAPVETPPVSLTGPVDHWVPSLLLSGPYPLLSWVVPFAVGLLLARVDLRDARLMRRLLLVGVLAAVAGLGLGEVVVRVAGVGATEGLGRYLTAEPHDEMPLWLLTSIGSAVAVLALSLLIETRRPGSLRWLGAYGTLAFTLYVAHVLVLALIQPPDGFATGTGLLVSLVLVLVAGVVAVAVQRSGRTGPLEWLLRLPWRRPRGGEPAGRLSVGGR